MLKRLLGSQGLKSMYGQSIVQGWRVYKVLIRWKRLGGSQGALARHSAKAVKRFIAEADLVVFTLQMRT